MRGCWLPTVDFPCLPGLPLASCARPAPSQPSSPTASQPPAAIHLLLQRVQLGLQARRLAPAPRGQQAVERLVQRVQQGGLAAVVPGADAGCALEGHVLQQVGQPCRQPGGGPRAGGTQRSPGAQLLLSSGSAGWLAGSVGGWLPPRHHPPPIHPHTSTHPPVWPSTSS